MNILGLRIDPLTIEECMRQIKKSLSDGEKLWIVTANPELIVKAQKDYFLYKTLNSADIIVPDGIGVVWAAGQLGCRLQERVTGVDLTTKIFEEGNSQGWKIFLLGAKPEVVKKAVLEQQKKYPGIIFAYHHGYFNQPEEKVVVEQIKAFRPDILLAGLGAPKQEYWLAEYPGLAGVNLGVGGTIDVLAGYVRRAPQFYRRHNLEWLYRLVTQPARIRRQAILPWFVIRVLEQKFFPRKK